VSIQVECVTKQVFQGVAQRLPHIKKVELHYVSPKLLAVRDLELAVPGVPLFPDNLLNTRI